MSEGEIGSHVVLAEEHAWDDVVARALGDEAQLIGVSRWIGDSRTYAVGNDVALIRSTQTQNPLSTKPLRSEFSILRHLGIDAQFLEIQGFEVLRSPRVAGRSFDRARESMDLGDRMRVVAGTARALHRLHAQGVSHRDIRADNLILSDEGPVLIDFDQAVTAKKLTAALADWLGFSSAGLSPNPFWKFATFTLAPKSQSAGQRMRSYLPRREPDWLSPPPADSALVMLAEAWRIARASRANAPGQALAYYAFTHRGWHFPGERPWYLRWDHIRRRTSFAGKRVVDIGANMGLFTSFSLLHGASAATGIDHDADILGAAALVGEALGVAPEFMERDLVSSENWEADVGVGDLVACTSVRHWLADDRRLSRFLSLHREIIYEGHESIERETAYLKSLGFDNPEPLVETERGRLLFYARKSN